MQRPSPAGSLRPDEHGCGDKGGDSFSRYKGLNDRCGLGDRRWEAGTHEGLILSRRASYSDQPRSPSGRGFLMKYLAMGSKQVSVIGLGTWQFGERGWGWGQYYDNREIERIIDRALELGINFFDTAAVYGNGRFSGWATPLCRLRWTCMPTC